MDFKLINVGIADLRVAKAPDILRTILGSCVGVCLYDPKFKVGGLSHVMLPSINPKSSSILKYADTAIPKLIEELENQGANRKNIVAKIVGGAAMFNVGEKSIMGEIGKNNITKVKEVLKNYNIKIIAEDVGRDYGRTVDFYMETGNIKIKSIGREEMII